MKTVCIVTSGEYSDKSIQGVFDSQEKAQAFIEYETAHSAYHDRYAIEEWEVNEYSTPVKRGLVNFSVYFPDINEGDAKADKIGATIHFPDRAGSKFNSSITYFSTSVWAKNAKAALKIANERRVAYLLAHEQA